MTAAFQADPTEPEARDSELGIPNNTPLRRPFAQPRQVLTWVVLKQDRIRAQLTDLSLSGLGVLIDRRTLPTPPERGADIEVIISRKQETYSVKGLVAYSRDHLWGKSPALKAGVRMHRQILTTQRAYRTALLAPYFECSSSIRPQMTCSDPFYFNEQLYFQVNGFTQEGVDVSTSIRNSTLLPGQPLRLDLYIPGRGVFQVDTQVEDFCWATRTKKIHYFLRYRGVERQILEAISEYLILFSRGVTTKKLRDTKFPVGSLSRTIQFEFEPLSIDNTKREGLVSGPLGTPIWGAPSLQRQEFKVSTRGVQCKLGSLTAARAEIYTRRTREEPSKFAILGYRFEDLPVQEEVLELTNFVMSSEFRLSDFLMPFLQHLVRVAFQDELRFLLIEADTRLIPVLARIGFVRGPQVRQCKTEDTEPLKWVLASLDVKSALMGHLDQVDAVIWKKVFSDLNNYLSETGGEDGITTGYSVKGTPRVIKKLEK